jgi:hypothetical protein
MAHFAFIRVGSVEKRACISDPALLPRFLCAALEADRLTTGVGLGAVDAVPVELLFLLFELWIFGSGGRLGGFLFFLKHFKLGRLPQVHLFDILGIH